MANHAPLSISIPVVEGLPRNIFTLQFKQVSKRKKSFDDGGLHIPLFLLYYFTIQFVEHLYSCTMKDEKIFIRPSGGTVREELNEARFDYSYDCCGTFELPYS